jgi:RNA-directed DNA polymerase
MVKTDIHDFFPSVTETMIYKIFYDMGYASLLAFELARICTWPGRSKPSSERPRKDGDEAGSLPYTYQAMGTLPQGAPTSGALSNAFMRQTDEALAKLALRDGLVYTRYSDDITLSAGSSYSRSEAKKHISEVRRIVTASGLALHAKKTRVVTPGARKVVLGMLVVESGIAILPEHRRMVSLYVHASAKYGIVDFAMRRGFSSPISFINHVEGWLAYLVSIDEEWTRLRAMEWRQALESQLIYAPVLR